MKRSVLIILFFLTTFFLQAQVLKTVNVTAGGLATALTAQELNTITNLTVNGSIDNSDFITMRTKMPKLSVLDLRSVTIVTFNIPSDAFFRCSALTSISLPDNITTISSSAFYCCTGLASITIPNSVTRIESYAFNGCTGLTSIEIPSSVTFIDSGAFDACFGLTSIVIPASVTVLKNETFLTCRSLKEIHCQGIIPPNLYFACFSDETIQSCLLYVPKGTLEAYKSAEIWKEFTTILEEEAISVLKDSATINVEPAGSLATLLGSNADLIKDLTLSGSLNIEDIRAIRAMKSLNFLNLSDANIVTSGYGYHSIKDNEISHTFGLDLKNLISIQLPNSLIKIGDNAFQGCTSLTNITIPAKVTSISNSAFLLCPGLKEFIVDNDNDFYSSIDGVLFNKQKSKLILYPISNSTTYSIPSTVNVIGEYSFSNCNYLTSVTIPNTVTDIGHNAFYKCTGLTSIIIPNSVTRIGGYAFNRCTGLTSINIPSSVTIIDAGAFLDCYSLTSIVLPDSITFLEGETFLGCSGLKKIHCQSISPPRLYPYCFSDETIKSSILYVPKGTINAYKNADVWKDFTNIREEDGTSGTIDNNSLLKIIGAFGNIQVQISQPVNIAIYKVDGKKVFDDLINQSTQLSMRTGVYIVKARNKSYKVFVY